MRKITGFFYCIYLPVIFLCFTQPCYSQSEEEAFVGLHSRQLPARWDEGFPLGNGILGALIYQKDGHLRLSLDRADLWDLRPMDSLNGPRFSYQWIYQQVLKKDYTPVQKMLDVPYDREPAPSKIPAGALEFSITNGGDVQSAELNIHTATATVRWENGQHAVFFIDAFRPVGHFRFEGVDTALAPMLIPPPYTQRESEIAGNAVTGGQELARLGYEAGVLNKNYRLIHYHQKGWGRFSYDIAVAWKATGSHAVEGTWSITSSGTPYSVTTAANELAEQELKRSFDAVWRGHKQWWQQYWSKSSVHIPDSLLQHQYEMEMYKFGAASRQGGPPITLQAVWTADNGKLPPWKGDFHNDLNTQLSYWPGFAANHPEESAVFTDWLWMIMPEAENYTRTFFKNEGLNVPGVSTLTGAPMGGWAQYSLSPTVACWLAQNFYWQWIYSKDENFLRERAYPWVKSVAKHIESIAQKDSSGHWSLPISSSPEFYDNSLKAWFLHTSNYDLSLIRWLLQTAVTMASDLKQPGEVTHWKNFLSGWPALAVNPSDSALLIAPGFPYNQSHRHFSHLMSIYPLQLLDWYHEKDRKVIKSSLAELEKYGSSAWCGYSYAWEACLKAMAQDGEGAEKALKIFASAFCSPNSFHLNGDQSGKGYSSFTYRPFTLEGNFAFAQGVQLMLLQQHDGVNYLFPAIPEKWGQVSFQQLRAPGAFLISATRKEGKTMFVKIHSLEGGVIDLENPFKGRAVRMEGMSLQESALERDVLSIFMRRGQEIKFYVK